MHEHAQVGATALKIAKTACPASKCGSDARARITAMLKAAGARENAQSSPQNAMFLRCPRLVKLKSRLSQQLFGKKCLASV